VWKLIVRLRAVGVAVRKALTPTAVAWSAAANALLLFLAAFIVWTAFDDVIPYFSVEKLLGLVVLYTAFAAVAFALLLIFWLPSLLKPRFRFALFLLLPPLALFSAIAWAQGAAIAVPLVLVGVSFFVGSLAALRVRVRAGSIVFFLLGAGVLALIAYGLFAPQPDLNPALAHYYLNGRTLALPDPAKPGPYRVTSFTYGSGKDLYRPEFAKGVRFVTRTVDGTKLDKKWAGFGGFLRTRYWGFDAARMPIQARVWWPEGHGPFPLVLIVHGNHRMEESSDPGYAFLTTLLASQGFIVASVDENFLNSSLADLADPFRFRNGEESQARGWLLLEHLKQWRAWNADASNPLHGKVDMGRIALVGHSRGGEAVAIANAFNDLDRFPDDATLPFDFHFHLRGIAAIAPVDGQYKPRDWPTPMRDTNYFVIQGSMDGDVISFMGSSQYARDAFTGKADAFRASLYVKGANHGQFNLRWGRNDNASLPAGALLDERPIMPGDAQRRILKVYLAAFLHTALKGEDGYRPLFQDPRNGAGWLPDDYLVGNYADSRTAWLADYEEDLDPTTGSEPDVAIAGDRLSVWREDYVGLKDSALGTQVALIAWDDRVHKAGASYAFEFRKPRAVSADSDFVFSASQSDIETLPKDFKADGPRKGDDKTLDWSIVLSDANGNTASLPLSRDQLLYPQVKAETRRAGQIDFIPRSELVFRRFRFPFRAFAAANPALDLAHLRGVRFSFDRSARGAIALDDVGIAASHVNAR
jgi:dienelactone hydrolase